MWNSAVKSASDGVIAAKSNECSCTGGVTSSSSCTGATTASRDAASRSADATGDMSKPYTLLQKPRPPALAPAPAKCSVAMSGSNAPPGFSNLQGKEGVKDDVHPLTQQSNDKMLT